MLLSEVSDVFLRVPLLFALEAITKNGLSKINSSVFSIYPDNSSNVSEKVVIIIQWNELLKYFSMMEGFVTLLMLTMTHRKFLLAVYMWAFSLGSIMTTYACNQIYVRYCMDIVDSNSCILIRLLSLDREAIKYFFGDLIIAGISARVFCATSKWLYRTTHHSFLDWTFLSATPLSLIQASPRILRCIPGAVALPSLGFVFWKLSREDSFNVQNIQQDNAEHADEIFTNNVPLKESLAVYWILRAIGNLLVPYEWPVSFSFLLEKILVKGCDSYMAVLGIGSVVSFLSTYLLDLVHAFLHLEYSEPIGIGEITTILFLVLALQKHLPSLEPQERLQKLHTNFYLALNVVLHFVHLAAHTATVRLGVSNNAPYSKHIRALSVCISLITVTCFLSVHLWHLYPEEAWVLTVLLFNAELFLNILVTLMVYTLNMVDLFKDNQWEHCEDYIYYVTSFGHLVKFLVSVTVFVFAVMNASYSLSGVVTFSMLCLHAYVNIWCQAVAGIRSLILRISAQKKIRSLPEATQAELEGLQDVCSICYQPMTSARKSPCNHYFHEVCLKKWLYQDDTCPLCHSKLFQHA